ncbi:MAG: phenylalanine--tRNA ligase subunit beta [Elusimicrobiota bacterium]
MKISYNWLKDYLPSLDIGAAALARKMLGLGFEISSSESRGAPFAGIVAAKITSVGKHPNADRLSLCAVEAGGERFSVVCGAKNIAAGQVVPLAKPGARLPGGRVLAKTVIRGTESQGMLCSSAELGMGEDPGGILILDPGTPLGSDLSGILSRPDIILDVEITPNRPDCLSHFGLARELSVALGLVLRGAPMDAEFARKEIPDGPLPDSPEIKIRIESPQDCPFYLGRMFSGIDIRPSPGWLCAKLESIGLRPINNLVDITNYILMDMGQPLHAFDCEKLSGKEIAVRRAKTGEEIAALNGKTYDLNERCLVIADAEKPVAVAGVMGGGGSAVTDKTRTALLESAYFAPVAVRKTSQTLRLRSDSSYRFERGTDPNAARAALDRAASLIRELCGKSVHANAVSAAGQEPGRPDPITVSYDRINRILGSNFTSNEIAQALVKIAPLRDAGEGTILFAPPSWRRDLSTAWDLAEEIGRLLGYERIPAKLRGMAPEPFQRIPSRATVDETRKRAIAAGLYEAYNQDFVSEKTLGLCRQDNRGSWVRIANPLSEESAILRPSLLPELLQNGALNFSRGQSSIRLFEIGKTYHLGANATTEETTRLAAIMAGIPGRISWRKGANVEYDFYRVKGIMEEILSGNHHISFLAPDEDAAMALSKTMDTASFFHPGACALAVADRQSVLGMVGELHPRIAAALDFQKNVCLFEIDIDALSRLGSSPVRFKPYSQFPSSWRDISILLPKSSRYRRIEEAAWLAGGENLLGISLIDVFSGGSLEPGKISMTLRLVFSRDDKTLSDAAVSSSIEAILKKLETLGAVLRQK